MKASLETIKSSRHRRSRDKAKDKMNKKFFGILAMLSVCMSAEAENEIVWRDTFDDEQAFSRWKCDRGFAVEAGAGENGGGALVWEEKKFRPMVRREAEVAEGNAVRPSAPVGSTQC
jgi:hypothetical protein